MTVLAPTSAERRPLGDSGVGWQFNLPLSKEAGRMFFHGNGGHDPASGAGRPRPERARGRTRRLWAGSAIAAVTPMFHLMLESLVVWERVADQRETSVTLAPGFRAGWNRGNRQIVVGVAALVTRGDRHATSVLGYLVGPSFPSLAHRFRESVQGGNACGRATTTTGLRPGVSSRNRTRSRRRRRPRGRSCRTARYVSAAEPVWRAVAWAPCCGWR